MDRAVKLELIQRSLGLKHKLKVHDSMKQPDTHEDLAVFMLAQWELEDELRAIERILAGARDENVVHKHDILAREYGVGPSPKEGAGKKKHKEPV